VDPNAANRTILLEHLKALKLRVSAFGSLAEAEAGKSDCGFDVAIFDNDMPGLSMQAIQRIAGAAPLLLLCSLGRRDQGLAAAATAFSDHRIRLHYKPIKPSLLCDALVSLFADKPIEIPIKDSPEVADPTFAERRPMRLLLVEDNAVNQKLALLFLARIGYRADTANNGVEALQSLTRQHYDVIFMDMHMPEMDGLEAARRIRLMDAAGKRPWIIALTANAMQEDRDLCLAAGMDDFVSKPIQVGDLRRALLAVPERPNMPVDEPEAVEIPGYLKELMVEEPGTASELIQMFLTDAATNLDSLEAALLAADSRAVAAILHALKGSSLQMGAVSIARRCAQVEPGVIAGDLAECSAAVPGIRRALDHAATVFSTIPPAGFEV
jgi:CheY-like chemotaxis protein